MSKRLKQQDFVMQMVAHEMRTPLIIISQFLSMLQVLLSNDPKNGAELSEEAQGLRYCILSEELSSDDIVG